MLRLRFPRRADFFKGIRVQFPKIPKSHPVKPDREKIPPCEIPPCPRPDFILRFGPVYEYLCRISIESVDVDLKLGPICTFAFLPIFICSYALLINFKNSGAFLRIRALYHFFFRVQKLDEPALLEGGALILMDLL